MRRGELTESVRRRSVFRELHRTQSGRQSDLAFSMMGPLPGYTCMPWRQVTAAAVSLAAKGAAAETLLLQGILPEDYEETRLREDMKHFAAEAEEVQMEIFDADIQVSPEVCAPAYFVAGIGRAPKRPEILRPGQLLVMTRWAALAGTAALAMNFEKELKERFPARLIDRAREFDRFFSAAETARAVNRFGGCPMLPLSAGGIFGALWEMAETAGTGLEADLKKIPLRQETVEICEFFDLNPYSLYSEGALLIGTDEPERLLAVLQEADIPAAVIGRVTSGRDRVILNGDKGRFLDRPGQDEYWKVTPAPSFCSDAQGRERKMAAEARAAGLGKKENGRENERTDTDFT